MSCKPPCKPRVMLGASWWKRLGYNSPCLCALAKKEEIMDSIRNAEWTE